ncbi:4-aminobutyrate--2-oxoglutarate transaminase [Xanthobacter autotrophicus DSM 431]|uniref:4-aminobutyrate--2-oxoglutarate transaminase n=1 Tax=Xanthobacter nonsaccharivorans TaxID=3119912 RepID=UPI0037286DFC
MSRTSDLFQRRNTAVPSGVGHACPIFAERAANATLWDVEGREFIDFAGGIAVLNVGHCHPRVIAAARAQLDLFTHTSFQVAPYELYVRLCERLNALAPIAGPAKTLLVNSGAEAVENTVKIARAATGRQAVIAFHGAFHGRTLATTALTGKVAPYKKKFGPLLPDVFHAPFPAELAGVSVDDARAGVEAILKYEVDPERVAAIIIEPVQGEGGFYPAPAEFLRWLRALCDQHGILLIADEVQSGFARTGRLFAMEHSGVKPDLMSIAKSLAGGFPLAGVVGRAEIMDRLPPGGLGSTYGGHPVSCAAALATLDVIEEEGLVARAEALGTTIRRFVSTELMVGNASPVAALRGLGAMIAFDMVDPATGAPSADLAKGLVAAAAERGLILLTCGVNGNGIRLLMPLTIPDDQLGKGLLILKQCVSQLMAPPAAA